MEPMFNAQNDFSSSSNTAAESEISDVNAAVKAQQSRRMQRGVKWMLGGAGTLVFSFGLNFLLYLAGADPETPMYILTSLGAIGVLKGMADVFGI
ncbi:MAG: hypothetical protein IT261_14530 [Saprospiraceae bacterium]|nr:hypothetical protein [Saprospiraceae bacterium]